MAAQRGNGSFKWLQYLPRLGEYGKKAKRGESRGHKIRERSSFSRFYLPKVIRYVHCAISRGLQAASIPCCVGASESEKSERIFDIVGRENAATNATSHVDFSFQSPFNNAVSRLASPTDRLIPLCIIRTLSSDVTCLMLCITSKARFS